MQRTLHSLMVLILCFTACKKKEAPSPEIKTQLKSITGTDARTFEYNADGRASANNLTMEKIISKAGIVTYLGTMTMDYNDQGYVTKVALESRGSVRTNYYHY